MIRDLRRAVTNLSPVVWLLIALVLVGLALFPSFGNPYTVSLVLSIAMYVALTASWNILSGYAGYVSFGHVVFWGVGAYGTVILVTKAGLAWPLALVAGGLVAALLAAVVAQPILKLSGVYFAISTLALAEAMRVLTSYFRGLTGGGGGIYMVAPISLDIAYYLMIGIAVAAVGYTYTLNFTRFGRSLMAIRENELAAESLGIDTTWRKAQAFIVSAFLAGLLHSATTEPVNIVNARHIASGAGLEVSEMSLSRPDRPTSQITARMVNGPEPRDISGALINGMPHLVGLDGQRVDCVAQGHMLVDVHHDVPGIVGNLGQLLGSNGVNISFAQMGRARRGGEAIMILGLDEALPANLIPRILELSNIHVVRAVELPPLPGYDEN